ncbi:MAG TPA: hypothetical protein PK082_10310 [Phycisphaerae bacterium]|nr:hypothetical protein [Phycisphaerae bacterium]
MRPLRTIGGDLRGAATVEWILLMVGFGLPMVYMLRMLLEILSEHYRMVTFLEALPLP